MSRAKMLSIIDEALSTTDGDETCAKVEHHASSANSQRSVPIRPAERRAECKLGSAQSSIEKLLIGPGDLVQALESWEKKQEPRRTELSLGLPGGHAELSRTESAIEKAMTPWRKVSNEWETTGKHRKTGVSKTYCEVLGKKFCSRCSRDRERGMEMSKSREAFPASVRSLQHFTASTFLDRYLPELSQREIQYRVAQGRIGGNSFQQRLQEWQLRERRRSSPDAAGVERRRSSQRKRWSGEEPPYLNLDVELGEEAEKADNDDDNFDDNSSDTLGELQDMPPRRKLTGPVSGIRQSLYFSNIGELNTKIIQGYVPTAVIDRRKSHVFFDPRDLEFDSGSPVHQMFISPRKLKKTDRQFLYYEPPLLSLDLQRIVAKGGHCGSSISGESRGRQSSAGTSHKSLRNDTD